MAQLAITRTEAIKFGFEKTKQHFKFLLVLMAIIVAMYIVSSIIQASVEDAGGLVTFLVSIVILAVELLVGIGVTKITLNIIDGKPLTLSDLYLHYNKVLPLFLASLLAGLIVVLGFILLIIPGIIFAIKLQFVTYYIVDKDMGVMEAIKASWNVTKGRKWWLLGFGLLLGLLNLGGALALLIGLLVTYPTSIIAAAYVYRKIFGGATVVATAVAAAKTSEPPLVISSSQAPKAKAE